MARFCSHRTSAFTLVELLVVIAVIGIVAALFIGDSFSEELKKTPNEHSAQTMCANSTLALQEFRTDHHYYPAEMDPSTAPGSDDGYWMFALGNELGIHNNRHTGVWRCPSAYPLAES